MKQFVISLLISAMLLMSFGINALAASPATPDFNDNDRIVYNEAVEVLSSLGIISGYEDGFFYPAKPVTRAEMAKMICCLLNEEEGSAMQGPSRFNDMISHWASPYVNWCSHKGIITGKNSSTFDPNTTVTGVEAAKMLLVALGYDPIIEGFTGPTWEASVLKAARKSGLLQEGSALKLHTPLTREEAAQMMLNALDARIVYYDFQLMINNGETVPNYDSFLIESNQRLYEQKYSGILQKIIRYNDEREPIITWTVCL